jgi:hypothetical protein
MAAISCTVDLTGPRVGISLSAWTDGPVTVTRVHQNGDRITVRGVPDVSGGVSFAYDSETILGESFYYEAYSGSTLVTSGAVTVGTTAMYVSVPGIPSLSLQIDADSVPDAVLERPTADLTGPFRSIPATEYGELQSPAFDLTLRAESVAQALFMEQILRQSGVLLVRMPLTEYAATYVRVSRVVRTKIVHYRRQSAATTTQADKRNYTLSCLTVSVPVGGSYGDPTASYQALLDSGRTYQTFLDWKGVGATIYLDALRGGF